MGRGGARPNEAPTSKSRFLACEEDFYVPRGRHKILLNFCRGTRRLRASVTPLGAQKSSSQIQNVLSDCRKLFLSASEGMSEPHAAQEAATQPETESGRSADRNAVPTKQKETANASQHWDGWRGY